MTILRRKLIRETSAVVNELSRLRPVIVELWPPDLLGFRLKGTRRRYFLPTAACYTLAVKADVAMKLRERKRAAAEKNQLKKKRGKIR